MTSALEVPAMVPLQLTDAALFGLHLVQGLRHNSLFTQPSLTGRRTNRTSSTLTSLTRLPSCSRNAYLNRRRTSEAPFLAWASWRSISGVGTASGTLIRRGDSSVRCVFKGPIGIVLLFDAGQRRLLTERSRRAYYRLRGDCKQPIKTFRHTADESPP